MEAGWVQGEAGGHCGLTLLEEPLCLFLSITLPSRPAARPHAATPPSGTWFQTWSPPCLSFPLLVSTTPQGCGHLTHQQGKKEANRLHPVFILCIFFLISYKTYFSSRVAI